MEIQEIITAVNNMSKGKFSLEYENDICQQIRALSSPILVKKSVLRLTRIYGIGASPRTIIVAIIGSTNELESLLEWCASTKDELLDPESADLYMLGFHENKTLSLEECINIEASEQFCRKYIKRPEESLEELLERTFLGPIDDIKSNEELVDPLQQALANTAKDYPWLNTEEREKWRNAFLSGNSGADLIDILFDSSK